MGVTFDRAPAHEVNAGNLTNSKALSNHQRRDTLFRPPFTNSCFQTCHHDWNRAVREAEAALLPLPPYAFLPYGFRSRFAITAYPPRLSSALTGAVSTATNIVSLALSSESVTGY